MASFDHMTTLDSWFFRNNTSSTTTNNSIFVDLPWFAESFTRETETLTKALQQSISANDNSNNSSFSTDNTFTTHQDPLSPFLDSLTKPEATPTSAVSNASLSSSDPETPSKRQKSASGARAGAGVGAAVTVAVGLKPKIVKRKSRATKRSHTTFITADPENFRQMVQQVTGVRFGNAQGNVPLVLKPEPQRPGSRLTGRCVNNNILPTLDTSAFLLDQHVEQPHVAVGPTPAAARAASGPLSYVSPPATVAEGGCFGGALDFDSFACFPTLESWNAI